MMRTPTAYQLPPLEDAKRQYVELYGSSLVLNTYLKIALLCVTLVAAGLVVLNLRTQRRVETMKPLVIRIDDIGRAQAVAYDNLTYTPVGQAPELRYFLIQFVTKHYGRIRATTGQDYAESLYFLDANLAEATIATDQREQTIERFLAGVGDEVEIQVRNVTLGPLTAPERRLRLVCGHGARCYTQAPSTSTVSTTQPARARNASVKPPPRASPSSCANASPTRPSRSIPSA